MQYYDFGLKITVEFDICVVFLCLLEVKIKSLGKAEIFVSAEC